MSHSYTALIPLRGGSKSIPGKNIKNIAGHPLCAWVLRAATQAKPIDAVYVSTDSEEIWNTVESLDLGIKLIQRPAELASDTSSTESVMRHFVSQVDCETIITLQATSPLTTTEDIEEAIGMFEAGDFDSLLTAVRSKRFFWTDEFKPINYDPLNRPRRQDFLGTLMENGAFYITKREVLRQYDCRLGGHIGVYEMDPSTTLEIDEPSDWLAVEQILEESRSS